MNDRVYDNNELKSEKVLKEILPDWTLIKKPTQARLEANGADFSRFTWTRRPDKLLLHKETMKLLIVEDKSQHSQGSVDEKLTNPIWQDVYWPAIWKTSKWNFGGMIYVLTGFKEREKVTELMKAVGLQHFHTEDF